MRVEDKLLLINKRDCCYDCGSCEDLVSDDFNNSGFLVTLCEDCATFNKLEI